MFVCSACGCLFGMLKSVKFEPFIFCDYGLCMHFMRLVLVYVYLCVSQSESCLG